VGARFVIVPFRYLKLLAGLGTRANMVLEMRTLHLLRYSIAPYCVSSFLVCNQLEPICSCGEFRTVAQLTALGVDFVCG